MKLGCWSTFSTRKFQGSVPLFFPVGVPAAFLGGRVLLTNNNETGELRQRTQKYDYALISEIDPFVYVS